MVLKVGKINYGMIRDDGGGGDKKLTKTKIYSPAKVS